MELKTGHYYKWTGPKKREDKWAINGDMDFILDGNPHLCTWASGYSGAFEDSPIPSYDWDWSVGAKYMQDCGTNGGNMDKKAAIKRLDAIEEEAQKLREIIEKGDKIVYDETKIYVSVHDGNTYIMTGRGEGSGNGFVFNSLAGHRPALTRYTDSKDTGQQCLDYHVNAGLDIHEFNDTKKALQFFIDHL